MMKDKELSRISTHKCSICGTFYIERFLPLIIYGHDFSKWEVRPQCDCEKKQEEEKNKLEEKIRKTEREKSKGLELKNLIRKMRDVNIGKRFEEKTFSNFNQSRNQKAYFICLDYTKNFLDKLKNGKGLFLTGNVGTGKTHLIAAIIDRLAKLYKKKFNPENFPYHIPIVYVTATELFSQIKESFDEHNTEEVIKKFEDCKLLIIDDLGIEKNNRIYS